MSTPSDAERLLGGLDAPSTDALDALEASVAPPAGAQPEPEPVPRTKAITVHYRLGDGTVLEGVCTYTVPGVKAEHMIGLRCAQLAGGLQLDGFTAALVEQIAYLEVTLTNRPEWFREPRELPDPQLLGRIYAEVKEHEARFRGGARDLRPGAAPGAVSARGREGGVGADVEAAEQR